MVNSTNYQILLYYRYTPVQNPVSFMAQHKELCERLNLKGRIIIATEGINGTVEGSLSDTEEYIEVMKSDPRFANTHFKKSLSESTKAFPKLSIKIRNELVSGHLGKEDVNPNETTGKYIQAEELHKWINSDKEFYFIDMRNDYEYKVGHFKNSILPSLKNFRDLPKILPEIRRLKNKTVVTVCTGGVRCEKASGFLLNNGFKDVYQLYGGIVTYMEKYPEEDFHGKLYVFDGRVTMGFNSPTVPHTVVGRCDKCAAPSENYVNCNYPSCNKHFLCCQSCFEENGQVFCNKKCAKMESKRNKKPFWRLLLSS